MKKNKLALLFSLLAINAGNSLAAGYSTNLYSTSGLANSYAGSVTGVHDASDMFFNPAITSDLKSRQFIFSVSHLRLNIDPDNVQSNLPAAYGGAAISGSRSKDAGVDSQVPAFYYAMPINNKTSFGLSVSSPFGLATDYSENWAGRYLALESKINTVNINPSLAYRLNNQLSVGAGLQAQYYDATFTRSIFTGPTGDGFVKARGSDWGYGYNLGATYKVNDQLKLAIGYRSKIDHKIDGTINAAIPGSGNLRSNFYSKTTTPESVTIGAAFKPNQKLELVYDTTWTRWSRLRSLITNSNGSDSLVNATLNTNNTTNFNWRDSLVYSLGANYSLHYKWLIRGGLAYEKDAISDAGREPRVPVGNKIWLSAGFNYKISNSLGLDFAYVHQFYNSVNADVPVVGTLPSFQASYKLRVDVLSLALKKEF